MAMATAMGDGFGLCRRWDAGSHRAGLHRVGGGGMRAYWGCAGRSNMQGVEYARRIRGMVWQSDGILKGQLGGVLKIGASGLAIRGVSADAGRFRIDGAL